jgi:hypothetical protein
VPVTSIQLDAWITTVVPLSAETVTPVGMFSEIGV